MTHDPLPAAPAPWIALLTIGSFAAAVGLGCRMPFAALATLAALHMGRRDGILMVLMVWATTQVAGFALLDYAHDAETVGWGAALGCGAVAAVLCARATLRATGPLPEALRVGAALLGGYAGFKAVIAVAALKLGDFTTLVSPTLAARQLPREIVVLAGLLLAYRLLVAAGLPRAGRARLRLA